MKVVPGIVFCSIALCGAAHGQSGRRFERPAAAVTSAPNNEAVEAPETVPAFSESTPLPKRPRSAVQRSVRVPNIKPAAAAKSSIPVPAADPNEEVLKVETNLVTIPVSVFDRSGLYIPNLQQSDFKVFEDGKEQEISYFGSTDKPFTVVLLLDTSLSTVYKIEEIQNAAIAFINQLKPQDRVMVIEFDGNAHVLAEATNDRARLTKAIKKADFGYGTSLYDTVDLALRKRLAAIGGRKAIVLFTDGVDTTSRKAGYDSTLDVAEESDSLIFPIYYNTFDENRNGIFSTDLGGEIIVQPATAAEYAVGKKYLDELAAYTGGRVFRPEATPGGLIAAFEGIAEELRRQYNIGYVPTDDGTPGQRKQIKVRVNRPNLVVRARDSYVVGANAPDKPVSIPRK